MWSGVSDQSFRNYMYGDKVFILDEITSENCAFLIGDLTNFIFNPNNQEKELDFIINSPGGEYSTMMTIFGLMSTARLHDISIFTFVLGEAGSAASLLAVSGDMRYISSMSQHFIHFGSVWNLTQKHSEIEKIYKQNKEWADNLVNVYLKSSNGKLSKTKLLELESDERGYLNAQDCLKYGLVDSIIENDLYSKKKYELEKECFDIDFKERIEKELTKSVKTEKVKSSSKKRK